MDDPTTTTTTAAASVSGPTAVKTSSKETPSVAESAPANINIVNQDTAPNLKRGSSLRDLHAQPIPLRTFPMPTFFMTNPLGVIHIIGYWLRHTFFPPPHEPSVIHTGLLDISTRSVRVTDAKSMMDLWYQGFYGKGTLSRSEPNWLKREYARINKTEDYVSELRTAERRAERRRFKWERAQTELEALQKTRLEETAPIAPAELLLTPEDKVGVLAGPLELLALPNPAADLVATTLLVDSTSPTLEQNVEINGSAYSETLNFQGVYIQGGTFLSDQQSSSTLPVNDSFLQKDTPTRNPHCEDFNGQLFLHEKPPEEDKCAATKPQERHKSVRFSTEVQSTTYHQSGRFSPEDIDSAGSADMTVLKSPPIAAQELMASHNIVNKEWLQLSPEEALFLHFALGVLKVIDPASKKWLDTLDLLRQLKAHSRFTPAPRAESVILPDDPFMVNYVVYQHFRSLGWVVREGVKFGTDFMLYVSGPVFSHAEFGVIVMPSFSDPKWHFYAHETPNKPWPWLMCVNRVMSHAIKTLVLVYVDIPCPPEFDSAISGPDAGFKGALGLYKVREVVVKRWSSNRNR